MLFATMMRCRGSDQTRLQQTHSEWRKLFWLVVFAREVGQQLITSLWCDSVYTKMSKFLIPDRERSYETVVRGTFPIGNVRVERVKLGIMIDTPELYILMLVLVILTVIQCHRCGRKQKLRCQLFYKILKWFGWSLALCWNLYWWSSCSF